MKCYRSHFFLPIFNKPTQKLYLLKLFLPAISNKINNEVYYRSTLKIKKNNLCNLCA